MHPVFIPEDFFLVHKMSVYSVTAIPLFCSVSLPHSVWYSRKSNGEIIKKEFITSINIDVSSRICLCTGL